MPFWGNSGNSLLIIDTDPASPTFHTQLDSVLIGNVSFDVAFQHLDRAVAYVTNVTDGTVSVMGVPHLCNGMLATIAETPGNDTFTGTPGDDVIVGLAGNDTMMVGAAMTKYASMPATISSREAPDTTGYRVTPAATS